MLRASYEVLEPGGQLGGYTIHTPTGLSEADEALANDYGPSQVTAEGSPQDLAEAAGFTEVQTVDVTETFFETCKAIWLARGELEDELRGEEGDDAYEEEQEKKRKMLKGIDEGLLLRSLVVAVKP